LTVHFEWDNDKAARNVRLHGVSFEEACELFNTEAPVLEVYDADRSVRRSIQVDWTNPSWVGLGRLDRAHRRHHPNHQRVVGHEDRRGNVRRIFGETSMTDREELTREELSRALTRTQRKRIIAGKLEAGDVAALRRFVCLTQEQFAEALGISVHTLRNWEQDRVTPDGPGVALLRIAARHPRIVRENVGTAA
jgi:putative transcriptional regulator